MQELLQNARRDSLAMDVVTAMDVAEGVHRDLGKHAAADYGLDPDAYSELQHQARTAYETLCAMRVTVDRLHSPAPLTEPDDEDEPADDAVAS